MNKNKHNCEKWFDESRGCSICSNLLLKSPIKTKKELREIVEHCNWIVTEQKREIEKLKAKQRCSCVS